MSIAHIPVMPGEIESYMSPLEPGMRLCDATFGGGGHTARLLKLCSSCTITAIDADAEMIARGNERFHGETRLRIVHGWFDDVLREVDREYDRILMDLGVSMVHLQDPRLGFSFRGDGPLDMRLDRSEGVESAADLIRHIGERELADVIYRYGEERYSRRIARAIVSDRRRAASGTRALADLIREAVPPAYRRGRNHPATRTFQALRIAVNDELGRLERVLPAAAAALRPGGRLMVISFHSLEDRIVKHSFRALAQPSTSTADVPMVKEEGRYAIVTRKPIVPSEIERTENPAARSAKLRVLERGNADA